MPSGRPGELARSKAAMNSRTPKDIGCRYTPEMIELCKQALDLRRRGILKF